ncbi:hypothetical protein [Providencia vermicola]|uniref:hypothetical protein n=1 Tax=Providencia vermicola TaxID=333965 RepID=UPI0021FCCBBE|nr:hypothetical protein NFC79_09925 [Providencia stuartii]
MTLNELLKKKLAINGIWVDSSQINEHRHRFWLESTKKKYKKIRYQTQNGMKEVLFPRHVRVYEILALYIKELYGDGFFYAPVIENDVTSYYLICIKDDCIISPSDTIITESMLTYILNQKDSSEYASLNITVFNNEIFNAIYEEFKAQEEKYRIKSFKLYTLISISVLLFTMAVFILFLY